MAVLQPLIDLVQLCVEHGISRAVISPGSRSAALTLAFARNPDIHSTVVMDERSAAYMAMGMAQQLQQPVALVCTSGTAAYNFAPAVAEAFFQQIPLLVLTADRPPEWIHQNDGQTIYQTGIYGKHVKAAFQLPPDYLHTDALWFINRTINEAILTAQEFPWGPVHVNVPIREPFYPTTEEVFVPSYDLRKITRLKARSELPTEIWHDLLDEWESTERILIAVGQHTTGRELGAVLEKIAGEFRVPVLGDVISNLPLHELSISKHDFFLGKEDASDLRPDLLITVGQSFVSKPFKQFLQKYPPLRHWHISEDLHVIDTFRTLTTHVPVSPEYFFEKLFEDIDYQRFVQHGEDGQDESYLEEWLRLERRAKAEMSQYIASLSKFSNLTSLDYVLYRIPSQSQVHVANSMSIRYVNQLSIHNQPIKVFCNRGTSGIDGCVSTVIGAAMTTKEKVFLIVGDVAFFYDRNGLLITELPPNLKIILVNNSGGVIFRMIDGPDKQPELENYFETRHGFTAKRTCEDSKLTYFQASNMEELEEAWEQFTDATTTALLEILTNPVIDTQEYRNFKNYLKSRIDY